MQTAAGQANKSLGGMQSTGQTAAGGIAGAFKGAALGIVAAFGAREVISFARGAIDSASDLNESLNAIEVTYGPEAAEGLRRVGETAAEQFGIAQSSFNDAAVSFSAFADKIDSERPDEVFVDIAGRATDFASVMNIDVREALDKFRSGLAGESEPLRAFGLDLSAAAVAAYAVENGISESASAMTESEKVQARYGLLMEQTAKVAGDFAATADGAANKQRILNAKFEDAKAVIGTELMPVMDDLLDVAIDLVPVFADVAGTAAEVATKIVETVKPLTDAVLWLTEYKLTNEDATDASYGLTDALGAAFSMFTGNYNAALEDAGDLAEITGLKHADLKDDVEAAGRAADRAGSRDWPRGTRALEDVDRAAGDAAGAVRDLASAQLEAIDPFFKAQKAAERYEEQLEKVWEDGKITAAEARDLTTAALEADAAMSQVDTTDIQAAISAVADEFGIAEDEARRLILAGEELDTKNWEASVRVDAQGRAELEGIGARIAEAANAARIGVDIRAQVDQAHLRREIERILQQMASQGVFVPL